MTTLLHPGFQPVRVCLSFPTEAPGYERTEQECSVARLAALREAQPLFWEGGSRRSRITYLPPMADWRGRFTDRWFDAKAWIERHPIAKAAADAALISLAFVAVWGCMAGLYGMFGGN